MSRRPPRTPYQRYISSDGMEILVGRSARENDVLTFKVAGQTDFWFHVAATSGSHVIVLNPDNLTRLPRDTLREAAELAAVNSKSRGGGKVAVNYTLRRNVSKQRGAPAGQVQIRRQDTTRVFPANCSLEPEEE